MAHRRDPRRGLPGKRPVYWVLTPEFEGREGTERVLAQARRARMAASAWHVFALLHAAAARGDCGGLSQEEIGRDTGYSPPSVSVAVHVLADWGAIANARDFEDVEEPEAEPAPEPVPEKPKQRRRNWFRLF